MKISHASTSTNHNMDENDKSVFNMKSRRIVLEKYAAKREFSVTDLSNSYLPIKNTLDYREELVPAKKIEIKMAKQGNFLS